MNRFERSRKNLRAPKLHRGQSRNACSYPWEDWPMSDWKLSQNL